GQSEFLRAQFTALSRVVRMMPSGWVSPNETSRTLAGSCSLPTRLSKRVSPFIAFILPPCTSSRENGLHSRSVPLGMRHPLPPPPLPFVISDLPTVYRSIPFP